MIARPRTSWVRRTRKLLPLLVAGSLGLLAGACRRDHDAAPPPSSDAGGQAATTPAALAPSLAAPPGAATVSAAAAEAAVPTVADETLVAEDRERDPGSQSVTIKVIVDARRKAHVFWGRKDLGEAPLELQRPRNSGPMDLIVSAPGFLPLHTRALTDRDEKLILRLFSAEEAPQMLGYTAPPIARPSLRPIAPPPRRSR
jgi:hypothetical protein